MIKKKKLACDLLASIPLHKYKALIVSLDVQGEDSLHFDRLKYLLEQSSNCKDFNNFTMQTWKNQMWVTAIIGFLEND